MHGQCAHILHFLIKYIIIYIYIHICCMTDKGDPTILLCSIIKSFKVNYKLNWTTNSHSAILLINKYEINFSHLAILSVIYTCACILHVYCMYIACILHVYYMYITCILHVYTYILITTLYYMRITKQNISYFCNIISELYGVY